MITDRSTVDLNRAVALLGVSVSATDQELRAVYLQKVQLHPPDRDPDMFEKIRDAYEVLRDPDTRAQQVLCGADPEAPLVTLLDGLALPRAFAGSQLWIELLKGKRS